MCFVRVYEKFAKFHPKPIRFFGGITCLPFCVVSFNLHYFCILAVVS